MIGNGQLFLRNWCDIGIRVIYDLINEEGVFYSFEQLKAKYNIRGTFLDYQHVLNNISQVWKDQINMNRVFIVETKQNINEYIPQAKWQAEMGDIGEEEWKMYYRTCIS